MDGKCDHEVGKIGGPWHRCNRKARIASRQHMGCSTEPRNYYTLEYCERHERFAGQTDSDLITIDRVVEIES